jgi:hypothetical protein
MINYQHDYLQYLLNYKLKICKIIKMTLFYLPSIPATGISRRKGNAIPSKPLSTLIWRIYKQQELNHERDH